jgi:hypothetical protein
VREIALEYPRQPVRQAGFVINALPAVLDYKVQCPGVLVGWTPGPPLLPMLGDQFESELCIRWVILLAAGRQGFAKLGQHPRVDGIAHHMVRRQEGIDSAAFRVF